MDARHIDADVAIIGGGPGGSAAAICCARQGLRVVLFERSEFDAERPGETMHPGVRPILRQLGLGGRIAELTCSEHTGVWVEWGGPRRFQPYGEDADGPWTGFQVWRQDFDAALLLEANNAGAIVQRCCSVRKMDGQSGKIIALETDCGRVAPKIVIDASGRFRYIARQFDLSFSRKSPPLIARYGYVTGECRVRDEAPAIVGDATGWTWTARIREGLYQWTRVDFKTVSPDDYTPEEFLGMAPFSRTKGADVSWKIAERVAHANWFMIGDAAATLDPTYSRGVLKAMMTGMMAAQLAGAVIKGQMPSERASIFYHDWFRDWFQKDTIEMQRFYSLLSDG